MKKVLLIAGEGDKGKWLLHQTPGGRGVWRGYEFVVNDLNAEADFVVVRGKCLKRKHTFRVAPENVLLTTSEPYPVLAYPKAYCRQFATVCSCQEQLRHPGVVYTPPVLGWFAGVSGFTRRQPKAEMLYEDYRRPLPPKEKLLSVITSNKAFTRGHRERIRFVERLKAHYGDRLDLYGQGFRDFEDKMEVLAPYRYHIVIENSRSRYYFTEKLTDCYLAGVFPFYYGCTNVSDYFPSEAFRTIDVRDPDGAIRTIDEAIANDVAARAAEALTACRDLVLDKYNLFEIIAEQLDRKDAGARKQDVVLRPCRTMSNWHNAKLYLWDRNVSKLAYRAERLFGSK